MAETPAPAQSAFLASIRESANGKHAGRRRQSIEMDPMLGLKLQAAIMRGADLNHVEIVDQEDPAIVQARLHAEVARNAERRSQAAKGKPLANSSVQMDAKKDLLRSIQPKARASLIRVNAPVENMDAVREAYLAEKRASQS